MAGATPTNPLQPLQQPAATTTTAATTAAAQPAAVPKAIYPTTAQLLKVCPGTDVKALNKYAPILFKAMCKNGLTSKNQLIAIVATVYCETFPKWTPSKEGSSENTPRYDPYRGRGLIQLTWKANYESMGKFLKLGDQLVKNPDMAMREDLVGEIYVGYWKGVTGNNPSKPAEKGDWRNARIAVNGGDVNGYAEFMAAVNRGIQVFDKGLDPNAIGVTPVSGDYGVNSCMDTNGGNSRDLNAMHTANSQGDLLAYALGLHALDRMNSHEFQFELDVAAQPELLDIDVQKKVGIKNFGDGLDGDDYVVKDAIFTIGDTLTLSLTGTRPDPNAPATQVYLHDTNQGMNGTQPDIATGPVPTGEIPGKIFAAAKKNKGQSSRMGPGGGNVACAFCVNRYAVLAAGLKNIGAPDGSYGCCVYVPAVVDGLKGGRGQQVARAQSVPGDIWIANGMEHIGICMTAGCTKILSNSSSRASFAWEDGIDSVNGYYGGKENSIWRVTS